MQWIPILHHGCPVVMFASRTGGPAALSRPCLSGKFASPGIVAGVHQATLEGLEPWLLELTIINPLSLNHDSCYQPLFSLIKPYHSTIINHHYWALLSLGFTTTSDPSPCHPRRWGFDRLQCLDDRLRTRLAVAVDPAALRHPGAPRPRRCAVVVLVMSDVVGGWWLV